MRLNLILITLLVYIFAANALSQTELPKLFAIEGRISFRSGVIPAPAWQAQTTIYVDYQKHLGFVRYIRRNHQFRVSTLIEKFFLTYLVLMHSGLKVVVYSLVWNK